MKNPKVSLLISTYNWPEALNVCLKSAINQNTYPDEIIITDDGSKNDTKELIESYKLKTQIPIKHVWQEDNGFRLARSRNLGIAAAQFPYICIIDGDLILHPDFIKDQKRNAQKSYFLQGTRVITPEVSKENILKSASYKFSPFASKIKNRKNNIHSNLLSQIFSHTTTGYKAIRGCNMSFWKEDLIQINGFNENFTGWGREDSELVARLYNIGVRRKNIKFNCLTAHIYHNERSQDSFDKNTELYLEAAKNKISRCEIGLDQHLS